MTERTRCFVAGGTKFIGGHLVDRRLETMRANGVRRVAFFSTGCPDADSTMFATLDFARILPSPARFGALWRLRAVSAACPASGGRDVTGAGRSLHVASSPENLRLCKVIDHDHSLDTVKTFHAHAPQAGFPL